MLQRREFVKSLFVGGIGALSINNLVLANYKTEKLIKPPKLNQGDTVGIITPASPLFEAHQTVIEVTEKMGNLGYKVKPG